MHKNIYLPDDYDNFNVLKIPASLYLLILYLLKYPLIALLANLPRMQNMGFFEHFARQQFFWDITLSYPFAILVFIAALRRRPEAHSNIQKIWHYGRQLLIFAISLQLASFLIHLPDYSFQSMNFHNISLITAFIIDILVLLYLFKSNYLRDMFKEFPTKKKSAKKKKNREKPLQKLQKIIPDANQESKKTSLLNEINQLKESHSGEKLIPLYQQLLLIESLPELEYYLQLAQLQEMAKDFSAALETCQQALLDNPENPQLVKKIESLLEKF